MYVYGGEKKKDGLLVGRENVHWRAKWYAHSPQKPEYTLPATEPTDIW